MHNCCIYCDTVSRYKKHWYFSNNHSYSWLAFWNQDIKNVTLADISYACVYMRWLSIFKINFNMCFRVSLSNILVLLLLLDLYCIHFTLQGQEYTEAYVLEYQREDNGQWLRFRNRGGDEVNTLSFYLHFISFEITYSILFGWTSIW